MFPQKPDWLKTLVEAAESRAIAEVKYFGEYRRV
jgi:hypothetical protein